MFSKEEKNIVKYEFPRHLIRKYEVRGIIVRHQEESEDYDVSFYLSYSEKEFFAIYYTSTGNIKDDYSKDEYDEESQQYILHSVKDNIYTSKLCDNCFFCK